MLTRFIHRYLDPSETLLEILFGLIMALTLTAGARLLSERHEVDPTGLAGGLLGCNVAWGIIDAVFYLLGTTFNRNQRVQFVRRLRSAASQDEAIAAIKEEFGLEGEPAMRASDKEAFYKSLVDLFGHAAAVRARFRREDFVAAALIVPLVSMTAIPGVVCLFLIGDAFLALRVANVVQICLLFLVGFGWAHYSGGSPCRAGLTIGLLGTGLVLISVALGG